jgi:hypothetical protein
MAGENIPERVVRKVFASSIDLVIHLDRDIEPSAGRIRRQTVEIRALVPSLHDDFSSEPLFQRDRLGAPLRWTGALPPNALVRRLEGVLPRGSSFARVMEGTGAS